MYTVLLGLRVIIAMGVGLLVWYVFVTGFGSPTTLVAVLLPVWIAGVCGGAVCMVFSPRQGLIMAFVSGVILALGFLWTRHVYYEVALGPNSMITLWPVWFPAAYYVGAFGYASAMSRLRQ